MTTLRYTHDPRGLAQVDDYILARHYAAKTRELYMHAIQGLPCPLTDTQGLIAHLADIQQESETGFWPRLTYNAINVGQAALNITPTLAERMRAPIRHPLAPACHPRETMRRICETPNMPTQRAMLTLAYACALRVGEVVQVRAADALNYPAVLLLPKTKLGGNERVFLPPKLQDVLRQTLRPERDSSWLFPAANPAAHITEATARRIYDSAQRSLGLEPLNFHSIRHAAAIHALESGASLEQVRRMLRHKSLNSTQVYLQCVDLPPISPIDSAYIVL